MWGLVTWQGVWWVRVGVCLAGMEPQRVMVGLRDGV